MFPAAAHPVLSCEGRAKSEFNSQGIWKRVSTRFKSGRRKEGNAKKEEWEEEGKLTQPDLSHLVAVEMEGRQLQGLPDREGSYFWNGFMKGKV